MEKFFIVRNFSRIKVSRNEKYEKKTPSEAKKKDGGGVRN